MKRLRRAEEVRSVFEGRRVDSGIVSGAWSSWPAFVRAEGHGRLWGSSEGRRLGDEMTVPAVVLVVARWEVNRCGLATKGESGRCGSGVREDKDGMEMRDDLRKEGVEASIVICVEGLLVSGHDALTLYVGSRRSFDALCAWRGHPPHMESSLLHLHYICELVDPSRSI